MNVVISGSTGLIGGALIPKLEQSGHRVVRLVRDARQGDRVSRWSPYAGELDADVIESADAVINLSGENVGGGLWTQARKNRIRASRIETTELLANTIAQCERGPRVFVCASAIGYYGTRPGERLTEETGAGEGFLADLGVEWEAAAAKARSGGARVVSVRTGLVLSGDGGVIAKMLLPFKLGLGGPVAGGEQMMSWISIDDVVRVYQFVLEEDAMEGPVNAVSPNSVSNHEFTKALGAALGRPTILPLPEFLLKAVFGEMAEETLLVDQNVIPSVLQRAGFAFEDPEVGPTLQRLLG